MRIFVIIILVLLIAFVGWRMLAGSTSIHTGTTSVDEELNEIKNVGPKKDDDIGNLENRPRQSLNIAWSMMLGDKEYSGQRAYLELIGNYYSAHMFNTDSVNLIISHFHATETILAPEFVIVKFGRGERCYFNGTDNQEFNIRVEGSSDDHFNATWSGKISCESVTPLQEISGSIQIEQRS